MQVLNIAFSPCPNDTFIFDALVHEKIDTRGIRFRYHLEDVETLNQWAFQQKIDITKLSYNAFLHLAQPYALLHSGSALGKGVGPLLIARQPLDLSGASALKIAIPGVQTTANLLLSLALPEAQNKNALVFNQIEDAVLSGEYDAGLIIHENRFTYQSKGLVKLMDLGDWWEQTTQSNIPLGGIVMKRSFPKELITTVDELIRESVSYAWNKYPQLPPFVTENAQEMEESVMRQHIELYVNEYTTDLWASGQKAVETLFQKAITTGLIRSTQVPDSIFY